MTRSLSQPENLNGAAAERFRPNEVDFRICIRIEQPKYNQESRARPSAVADV
jgi:hypothetical protein